MAKSSKIESGTKKKGKDKSEPAPAKAAAPVAVKPPVAAPVVAKAPAAVKPTKVKAEKKPEVKKAKPEEKPKKASKVVITNEDIGLRAYYIAERRRAMGWAGDETSDWVEAELQLKKEAAAKKK